MNARDAWEEAVRLEQAHSILDVGYLFKTDEEAGVICIYKPGQGMAGALMHARTALLPVLRTVEQLDTAAYRDLAARHFEETGVTLPRVESTSEKEAFCITFGTTAE